MVRSSLSRFTLVVLCAWSIASSAHAYRPFDGTDGDVADLGEFELELGPAQFFHSRGHDFLLTPATVLNLGIFQRTELVVDFVGTVPLQLAANEKRYQVRSTDVFLKVLLREGVIQDATGPSIALEAGPLTPEVNGDKGFGASANLIISERWSWLVAHLDNVAELSRRQRFSWMNTLITEFRFSETIWPVTELLWSREIATHQTRYSALVGGIWAVSKGVDLDAAVIVGSIARVAELEARLGFTWAFQVWGLAEPEAAPRLENANSLEGVKACHERMSGACGESAGSYRCITMRERE